MRQTFVSDCHFRSSLRSQLSKMTSHLSSIEASHVSPDISISWILASVMDFPRTMVLKVFEALRISRLAVDVKDSSVIAGNCQRPSAADGTSLSFIVNLKSLSIGDHIVSRKRQITNLTIYKVFEVNRPGKIFVREFLPAAVYGLLRRTKVVSGAPNLRKWSTTLEIKIHDSANGQKGRTVRCDIHKRSKPYPAGSLLYPMKTKMPDIKKVYFCTKLFINTLFIMYK